MTDPLKERIIAKTMGMEKKPQETISDVKKQTENMGVIEETLETAKKLSGANVLEKELERKDQKVVQLEKERDKATEEKHAAEIQTVRSELGSKIDGLAESIKGGASQKSIGDQITDIKKAAEQLGMGGSKISEIKDMYEFIERLNPKKNLVDQVKEAKELIATLQPPEDKGKGVTVEGLPVAVALQLKQMDHDLEIKLAQMADDRQRRDQEFTITMRRYDEDRIARQEEVQGKLQIERERNELIAGVLGTLGKAIGKGIAEGGGGMPAPSQRVTQRNPKTFYIPAQEGQSGTAICANCRNEIGFGPTQASAKCANCDSDFPIVRTPAVQAESSPAESEEE